MPSWVAIAQTADLPTSPYIRIAMKDLKDNPHIAAYQFHRHVTALLRPGFLPRIDMIEHYHV